MSTISACFRIIVIYSFYLNDSVADKLSLPKAISPDPQVLDLNGDNENEIIFKSRSSEPEYYIYNESLQKKYPSSNPHTVVLKTYS